MPDINILSPHVADLIAAGEVVERPASVIKELLENSFDALASNVTIEMKDGGLTFIRVTDDGAGMLPEDAGVCFLRHATSKLRDERGLERIGTMGFRGEALAAISAVSKIELITRKRGTEEGTRVLIDAGEITGMGAFGCPEGTSITVRGIFHNTPARLKFMKSDRSEATACVAAALRCALARPEVSVRMIRDGREEFFSPGDGKRDSAVYSLLGRELAGSLLECSSKDEDISVSGFVSAPHAGHGNRGKQFFFVGGRAIRSALLQSAVEQAYKNTLLTGRFPACVIWLEINPASVDVNVHPAKTEIRFRDERKVFDAVYYAALAALRDGGTAPEIKLSPGTKAAVSPQKDFFQTMTASEYREKHSEKAPASSKGTIIIDRRPTQYNETIRDGSAPYITRQERMPETFSPPPTPKPAPNPDSVGDETTPPCGHPSKEGNYVDAQNFRLVGEAMKTYIIVEAGEGLLLIDKHAAHERIIFDRLKRQNDEIMSQCLIIPVTVKLSARDVELVEGSSELLRKLGLEIEPFGEDSVILRGVPADTDASDAPAMVEEICEKLRGGLSLEGTMDGILHTIACKAAIKAGWSTTAQELEEIARAVVSGEVKYCPHGRPVSVALTKKQLDKEFSRIV